LKPGEPLPLREGGGVLVGSGSNFLHMKCCPLIFSFLHQHSGIFSHRVGRVLSFFSSRRNWDSPNPSTAGECASPPSRGEGTLAGERGVGRVPIPTTGHTLSWGGGGAHSPAVEGLGESQFRREDTHCGTLLFIYTYFVYLVIQN
jgi:hypothetical protein